MSTKNNTDTQNQYNQNGMNAYNKMIPGLSNSLTQMAQSPLNSSYFQNQLGMAQKSAAQIGQRNMNNITANTRTGGGLLSGAGGYQSAMQNNAMLSNSSAQSGAFNSSLGTALQNRNFALQGEENFNPLQTGSKTQQYQSGAGTWIAPIASAALGAATGGMSMLAGGAASSLGSLATGSMGQTPQSVFGQNPLSGAGSMSAWGL